MVTIMTHSRLPVRGILSAALGLFMACMPAANADAQVSGLSYTVTPGIDRLLASDGVGLKSAFMPGARVGFGFGTYVELSGMYLMARGMDTDLMSLQTSVPATQPGLALVAPRKVDVDRYGAELKLILSRSRLVPFITGGTGVMRFTPDGLKRSEAVYLAVGAGLQIRIVDRMALILRGEANWYNFQPATTLLSDTDLLAAGLTVGDFEMTSVRRFSAGAGLKVYLGGRAESELSDVDRALQQQLQGGLKRLSLVIEPAYSLVRFAPESGLRRSQRFATVAAGLDFGSFVGVRGFYWRGLEEGKSLAIDDVQAFGGEMKFNLTGDFSGLRPYLTLGGGRLDVLRGYVGDSTGTVTDQTFAMGGFGVQIPVSRKVLLFASARSLLMAGREVNAVSDPSTIHASTSYSAGLSLGIGGGKSPAERLREAEQIETARRNAAFEAYRLEQALELARAQARADSAEQRLARLTQAHADSAEQRIARAVTAVATDSVRTAALDTTRIAAVEETLPAVVTDSPGTVRQAAAGGRDDRWMSIPVPDEGEIYIRFGKPDTTASGIRGQRPAGMEVIRESIPPGVRPDSTSRSSMLPASVDQATMRQVIRETLLELRREQDWAGVPAPNRFVRTDSAAVRALQSRLDDEIRRRERAEAQVRSEETARLAAERSRREADERASRFQRELDQAARDTRRDAAVEPQANRVADPAIPVEQAVRPGWNLPADSAAVDAPAPDSTNAVSPSMFGHGSMTLVSVQPVLGLVLNEPNDLLFGARAEFRQADGRLMVLPSVLIGVGDETALFADAHFAFDLGASLDPGRGFYAGAGIGLTTVGSSALTLNLLGGYRAMLKPGTFFAELVSAGPFTRTRLQAGYRKTF